MSIQSSICEWETLYLEGVSFSDERNSKLAGSLSAAGIVEILELARGIHIKSNSNIGRVDLGDFILQIRPKLNGLPLARLLSYAYGVKDLKLYNSAKYETDSLDFFDMLIYILYSYTDHLLRGGLSKGYVQKSDTLSAVRGRIDISRIASGGGIVTATLPCRYHQREEDTLLNRVLLSGLRLAKEMVSDMDLRYNLKRTVGILSETVTTINLDYFILTSAGRSITRLTEAYRPILEIIELLYNAQAPQIDTDGIALSLPGFFFDMNRFFEKLVSRLLKTLPNGYSVIDQYRLKRLFSYEPKYNPNRRTAPTPRPDFVLTKGGAILQLLDAKYRDLWETALTRDMLYQLSVYAVSGIGGSRATILYPALTDMPSLQVINIYDPIQGNKLAHVEMRPLNLIRISDMLAVGNERAISEYITETILLLPAV